MDHLNYAAKFGIISVLFLLPICFTSYIIMTDSKREITWVEEESQGLNLLSNSLRLYVDVKTYQDLRYVYVMTNKQRSIPADLAEKLRAAKGSIDKTLLDMATKFPLERLLARDHFVKLQQRWSKLHESTAPEAEVWRLPEVYEEVTALPTEIAFFIKEISISSHLAQDVNIEIFMLIKFITEPLLRSINALADVRQMGASALNESYVTSSTLEELEHASDAMLKIEESFRNSLNLTVLQNAALEPVMGEKAKPYLDLMSKTSVYLEEKILLAEDITVTSWGDYFSHLTAQAEQLNQLYLVMNDYMKSTLDERKKSLQQRRMTVVTGLTILLLIIAYLYACFYFSVNRIVDSLLNATRRMAKGDMTAKVDVQSRDELGDLSAEFRVMVSHVRELVEGVVSMSSQVTEKAENVIAVSNENKKEVQRQLLAIERVHAIVDQLTSMVEGVSEESLTAADAALAVRKIAETGVITMTEATSSVRDLSEEILSSVQATNTLDEESVNIVSVLDVIKGIAEQTNLLALNAAIEAARAGEHGRGFAVVADEVRKLAQKTHDSTKEIDQMIKRIQAGIKNVTQAMGNSREIAQDSVIKAMNAEKSLKAISASVQSISDISRHIASAVDDKKHIADAAYKSIEEIRVVGGRTADAAAQNSLVSQQMHEVSGKLLALVKNFKV